MMRLLASRALVRLLTGALCAFTFLVPASRPAFAAATVIVVNVDGAGEGFNDATVVAPVGGNTGTTRGQQRLIAFQHAADLWGATLDSPITVIVRASFDPLGANVLGSAGAPHLQQAFLGLRGCDPSEGTDLRVRELATREGSGQQR